MKTFDFRSSAGSEYAYFVLLHTDVAPDECAWTRYVEDLARLMLHSRMTVHVFAVTDGGGPGPRQRQALADVFALDRRGAMTHVFTTSAFTRGIVTAFHWLARSRAVAHHPDVFPLICEQCQVPMRAVLDDLLILQKALPPVALLAQIERAASARASQSRRGPT